MSSATLLAFRDTGSPADVRRPAVPPTEEPSLATVAALGTEADVRGRDGTHRHSLFAGLGGICSLAAPRMAAFGMTVVAYAPCTDGKSAARAGVRLLPLAARGAASSTIRRCTRPSRKAGTRAPGRTSSPLLAPAGEADPDAVNG